MNNSTKSVDLLLGLDGGGSKTLALLADATSRVLGRGTAGSSNYQNIGAEAAWAALDGAIAAAFADAGRPVGPLAAVCLGLAGVDRPEDRTLFEGWAAGRFGSALAVIANDAELVLAAGTPDDWGVAVISGTGSIVFGRHLSGEMARAGGWGHILGDEGSGYAIGIAALRAAMCAFDGRGPQTALTAAVLAHWGLAAPPDLVGRVYREDVGATDIAGLARLVDAVAAAGDAVARGILHDAGRDLAVTVEAVVRQLDLAAPTPCALAGGVVVHGAQARAAFLAAAADRGLDLRPLTPVEEPARGAVRLATDLLKNWTGPSAG
jgi:N-acetylglucosamine kinase-like BadF-type ATPase